MPKWKYLFQTENRKLITLSFGMVATVPPFLTNVHARSRVHFNVCQCRPAGPYRRLTVATLQVHKYSAALFIYYYVGKPPEFAAIYMYYYYNYTTTSVV